MNENTYDRPHTHPPIFTMLISWHYRHFLKLTIASTLTPRLSLPTVISNAWGTFGLRSPPHSPPPIFTGITIGSFLKFDLRSPPHSPPDFHIYPICDRYSIHLMIAPTLTRDSHKNHGALYATTTSLRSPPHSPQKRLIVCFLSTTL